MYEIPMWRMIKEAVLSIGGNVISNAEIRKYIFDHYGTVHPGTINDQITVCSVNRQSRINYPENHKPRIANSQYDFLYSVYRGFVTLYNPDRHGQWEIALDGKLVVRQFGGNNDLISTKLIQPRALARPIQQRSQSRPDIESPTVEAVKHYLAKWEALENYKDQESAPDTKHLLQHQHLQYICCPPDTSWIRRLMNASDGATNRL